ncbi:aminotransferase class III-fold pyridoxal phosphate-dependent enzyme [Trichococcus shcherbakoviae]|uniref:Aminotransferase class III-fold pyridoxal phosphate-dependent enzyme n=1 Tax=Trichococcus shcherbakoviae subsp. psychrophilus TaxID=2585775 RepID=A0A5C5E7B4_9LACT|nr:aminotransferase class III-fold pyridoxal phosphate-dependent enzyme [Trichococcus shcherbakoviae]TNV68502.1 aminotransferase class III-fold pyridoxal phosphate-dependent enzyme [Trichococcus shcherbakoviae subsp. psychrophilus]
MTVNATWNTTEATTLTGEEVIAMDQQYVMRAWSKQGQAAMAVEKAEGIYFWDYEGNRQVDMSSLLVNANIGHQHPKVVKAIQDQAAKMCFMAPSYATDVKSLLAKKLVELAGGDMARVFFTNAGADANENAIKMARITTRRTKVFSGYHSYHGATLAASNASGDSRRFAAEIGGANGFVKFSNPSPYRDNLPFETEEALTAFYLKNLAEQIQYEGPYNVAAILLETVIGANGIIAYPKGYLEGVRNLCNSYGIVMICDEVMAGFYRTGTAFAFQQYGFTPDMITFAKGVTSGYVPLGGVIVSKWISEYFTENQLQCGLTYSGHTLACAAGLATLEVYEDENIAANVEKIGAILKDYLEEMKAKHPCVGDVRTYGLFCGVELVLDKETREPLVPFNTPNRIMPAIYKELKDRGFSTFGRETTISVCPPLTITEAELAEVMPILDEVLTLVDATYL